jgi:hypothetical protein
MSTMSTTGTQYAVNKTAKLAYKKVGDEWQSIDPKQVPVEAVRTGHEKIGDKWFHILVQS